MKTEHKLNCAMVGGGPTSFIGPIHRMALRLDDLADLVDGCYSHTDDWHRLLERVRNRVDFLIVATPNSSHYEIARAGLEAGLDVFCEKPLALTVREAETLGRIAAKNGRILGIPFTYTGYPLVKLARDLVRRGAIGRIDRVTVEYMQGSFRRKNVSSRKWKMDPKIAGPSCVLADIGVHAFTMVEYVTGLEVKSVLADVAAFGNAAGLEDDASVLMRLEGGAKATLVTSKIATGEENGVRLRVYGDKASLHWDQEAPNQLSVRYADAPERVYRRKGSYIGTISPRSMAASRFPAGHHEGFVEALANIYDEFTAAVKSRKTRDFPGPREGARAMKFVEASLKSAQQGSRWIAI